MSNINFAAIDEAVCRICNKRLSDVNNIGYHQTVVKIRGKLRDSVNRMNVNSELMMIILIHLEMGRKNNKLGLTLESHQNDQNSIFFLSVY